MNVIILGAGTVGVNVADYLLREGHDITLVDNSKERLSEVGDLLDVATLCGHATDPAVLERANVQRADLLLAFTSNDEVNLLAAYLGKRLGATRTVARVRNRVYRMRPDVNYAATLDIDLLLSPEILTAQEIVKFVDNPAALAMETYARGRVEMRRFMISERCELAGKALKDMAIPAGALVVSIIRGDEVVIPSGADTIEAGDQVALIGLPRQINEAQRLFTGSTREVGAAQEVVIAGGGETGLFLAETLEHRGHHVKLIEYNRERCAYLSEHLQSTTVIHGDVRDTPFLKEERVGTAAVFIATTGDDETNVMSSLLARDLGVGKTCCLVSRPDYVHVIEKTGVDLALSMRVVTANKVLSLVKRGHIRSISILEEGKAEIVEFQVERNSALVDKTLREIELPRGCLIATIVHRGQVQVPRGSSVIRTGDILIVAGLAESIDRLEAMMSPPSRETGGVG
jgi:trk system potassium uptake protein TrkA